MTLPAPGKTGIFVINLARCPDRLQWMTGQLGRWSLPFERIEAVDGDTADLPAEMSRLGITLAARSPWPPGARETANYLSHMRAWGRMAALGLDAACILEDDTEIRGDLGRILDGLAAMRDRPWVVRMEPWHRHALGATVDRLGAHDLVYTSFPLHWTAGYCVTAAALRTARPILASLRTTIDTSIHALNGQGVRVLSASPAPVVQSGLFPSLLEGNRENRHSRENTKSRQQGLSVRAGLKASMFAALLMDTYRIGGARAVLGISRRKVEAAP